MTRDEDALSAMVADLAQADSPLFDRSAGGVAAIVRGESVTGSIAFGCANLASGLAWSIDVPGRIASVSKPMAAQVMLGLCDDGVIDLDMRFGDVLSLSPSWAQVRLRDALAMKAGLPDEYPLIVLATGGGVSEHHDLDHRFALLRPQSHLNFPAGTRTLYANTGYTLAQRLAAASADLAKMKARAAARRDGDGQTVRGAPRAQCLCARWNAHRAFRGRRRAAWA